MPQSIVLNIPFPLLYLFWYGCTTVLVILNYSLWVRFERQLFSDDFRNFYLACCILGMLTYAAITGPYFFNAYKYSTTEQSRYRKMRIGLVSIYFSHVCPLFVSELWIAYHYGVLYVLDGIVFVLLLVTFFVGTFSVWFIYMWQVARLLHRKSGNERLVMFTAKQQTALTMPPLSHVRQIPGQPEIV